MYQGKCVNRGYNRLTSKGGSVLREPPVGQTAGVAADMLWTTA
jgi:hypothetical protein